jgi:hypothetical protein
MGLINRLTARTGLKDVHSDKRESALVHPPVRAPEITCHEAHIRVQERIPVGLTGLLIRLGHHAIEIREADEPVKIGYRDRLGINRMSPGPNT